MSELVKFDRSLWLKQKLLSLTRLNRKASIFAVVLIVVLSVAGFVYLNNKNKSDAEKVLGENNISLNQAKDLVSQVGKLADLPSEIPSIATVSDITKLSNQTFFASAQNGDKVLIFKDSNKAVIYRPTTNKIIAYDTITFEQPTPVPDPNVTATPSATISQSPVLPTTIPVISRPIITLTPSPSGIGSQ